MGATRIVLDPSGYYRVSEPGFHWMVTGRQLLEERNRRADQMTGTYLDASANLFMGFPGLDWIALRPDQLYPLNSSPGESAFSTTDPQETDHIFATGLGQYQYDAIGKLGEPSTMPARFFWGIPQVPDPAPSLDSYNYTTLADAVNFEDVPAGRDRIDAYKTICWVDKLSQYNPAADLNSEVIYPTFYWLDFPGPYNTVVWGFHEFAVVCSGDSVTILRDLIGDGQSWRVLATAQTGNSRRSVVASGNLGAGLGGLFGAGAIYVRERGICVMPAGPEHLAFIPVDGDPIIVRIGTLPVPAPQGQTLTFPNGWWLAAGPYQRLSFRWELTSYTHLTGTLDVGFTSGANSCGENLFSLPAYYAPTAQASIHEGFLHLSPTDTVTQAYDAGYGASMTTNTRTGEAFGAEIINEDGARFVANGVRRRGGIRVVLVSGISELVDAGTHKGYGPQFRALALRFPPVLAARANSSLTIGDTYYQGIRMSSSLRDPDGKEIEIEMLDAAVGILTASGLDARESYPVEVQEDTTGLGTWTVRARGWLTHPDMLESHAENASRANPVRSFTLRAKGLLSRGNDENGKWLYLPQMVDPSSLGTISHSFIVGESLRMMGIDTTDVTQFLGSTDPFLGTNIANLPGTWSRNLSTPGYELDSPWSPDWEESKLDYAARIAREWRGWLLFELLSGLVRYRSDQQVDVTEDGLSYAITATIYKDKANAVAAGVAGQYWMTARRWIETPKANVVRVSGEDADGQARESIIERDLLSLTTTSYRNFLGEERVRSIVSKLAIDVPARIQLARMALRRWKRRRIYWEVVVPLAHWQIGVDVGDIVTLQNRGDYLLNRVTTEILARNTYRCTLLGERLD